MRKLHLLGANADVDSAAAEDVWTGGGDFPFQATAAATTIVSGSVADDSAGTGARTVRVIGLDSTLKEISEDVIMDGTTPVALTNQFFRVNSFEILTVGSGGVNAGVIDVKHATTVIASMAVGDGRARQAVFTAPNNQPDWRVVRMNYAITNGVAGAVTFNLMTRKSGKGWQVRETVAAYGAGACNGSVEFKAPIYLDAGEDVKIRATAGADNSAVAASFDVDSD